MPTADDIEFMALATELVDEFERTATWISISNDPSDYSPATGENNPTETSHTINVAPAQASDPSSMRAASQFGAGSNTPQGEIGLVFAAQGLSFTPREGDRCTIDGVTWQCVGVSGLPASAPVYAWSVRLLK